MTPLLLDTHALLWWLASPEVLSEKAQAHLASVETEVYVSAASAWEISIKKALGKLAAPDDLLAQIAAEGFIPLPVRMEHALAVADLPLFHRDPFDRLLIAQARLENLLVVTRDPAFHSYDVRVLPA